MSKIDISRLPITCGVYIFSLKGKPIYIGKAINIKARIQSHIKNAESDLKERAIIEQHDKLTFLETRSEFTALILEAQLIKKHRPKYNVVWRDDKSYLYIKITVKETYPMISLTRKEKDTKSLYFGPFSSTRIARSLLYEIRRVIPFCTQNRITKKRCFNSKINLCYPCPSYLNGIKETQTDEYKELYKIYKSNIRKIISILKGKSPLVINELTKQLEQASRDMNYEDALSLRNRINYLTQLIESRSFRDFEMDVLLAHEKQVEVENVNNFMTNYLGAESRDTVGRFECYDISNLFGTNATASMVVFNDGRPEKKSYRRFKIKTVTGISDFHMMEEVLKRRLKRTDWEMPRLIILDGGKPQVRVGLKVKKTLGINFPLIGIAKHPDRIVIGDEMLRTIYCKHEPFYQIVQQIRDESHRFAKKYHTLLRDQGMMRV